MEAGATQQLRVTVNNTDTCERIKCALKGEFQLKKEEASFAQRVLTISSTNVFVIGKGRFSVIWAFCTQWKTDTEDRGKDEHFCYQARSILEYFANL